MTKLHKFLLAEGIVKKRCRWWLLKVRSPCRHFNSDALMIKNMYKVVQPLQRSVWRLLKKLNVELPYDSNPTPGLFPDKTIIQKDTCTPMFNATLFTIAKTRKQPKCQFAEEWISGTYIQRNITQQWKNEMIPFAAMWMDLELIILSEVSQTKKIKYAITYM